MRQHLDLLRLVLNEGSLVENRTGIDTLSLPGATMRFDLQEGFPAITTRKMAFKSSMGEMVGFLRAYSSAEDFRSLGCKVWDQNANENESWLNNPYRTGTDDLGPIYGVQWRKWPAFKKLGKSQTAQIDDAFSRGYTQISEGVDVNTQQPFVVLHKEIDQVRECLDKIMFKPQDRRIIFHGWNPADLDTVALPSCHSWYQFHCNTKTKELSLSVYIRSNDLGLGAPWNACESAALLSLMARLTGYTPRWVNYLIGDAHIYVNHIDMIKEQLTREPLTPPQLEISSRVPSFSETGVYEPEWLDKIEPSDFILKNYVHHSHLTAPMAV